MGWFGHSEGESRWRLKVEEFEYDVDAAYDLAKDTLAELERLKSCSRQLQNVSKQHEEGVLERLADLFEASVDGKFKDLVSDLRRASDAATQIGHDVDSMG